MDVFNVFYNMKSEIIFTFKAEMRELSFLFFRDTVRIFIPYFTFVISVGVQCIHVYMQEKKKVRNEKRRKKNESKKKGRTKGGKEKWNISLD